MSDTAHPPIHKRYNALKGPWDATLAFRRQLSQAFLSTEDNLSFLANPDDPELLSLVNAGFLKLLVELGPIFWKGVAGDDLPKYEIWLVHGHHQIKEDQQMVSWEEGGSLLDKGRDIMMPKPTESLPGERWDFNGQALEFRAPNADVTAPSADSDAPNAADVTAPPTELQKAFKRVMDKRGITALGLSVAPSTSFRERLSKGERFVERTGRHLRDEDQRNLDSQAHVTTFEKPEKEDFIQIAWIPCNPDNTDNPSIPFNYRFQDFPTNPSNPSNPDPAVALSLCASHVDQND